MMDKNGDISEDIFKNFYITRSRYKLYHTDEEWDACLKRWKREERKEKMNRLFGENGK